MRQLSRRWPFYLGVVAAVLVGVLVVNIVRTLPQPNPRRAAVLFAPTDPMLAEASIASQETLGALTGAYYLDSPGVPALLQADVQKAGQDQPLPLATLTTTAWQPGISIDQVAEGGSQGPFFTGTSAGAGEVGNLDLASGNVRRWALAEGAVADGIAVQKGQVFYLTDHPNRLHELNPNTGRDITWNLGFDTATSSTVVWQMREGGILHPRLGRDGDIYFTDAKGVGRLDPRTGTVTSWQFAGMGGFNGMAITASGVLYASAEEAIVRLDPRTGSAIVWCSGTQAILCQTGVATGFSGYHIASDGDKVYFATSNNSMVIGNATASSAFSVLPLGSSGGIGDLTVDATGGVYFTEPTGNDIGWVNPANGDVLRWPIPTGASEPNGIYVDKSGVYFTEDKANKLGRLDPERDQITEWSLAKDSQYPLHIKRALNGILYATLRDSQAVAALDPSRGGTTHGSHRAKSQVTLTSLGNAEGSKLTIAPTTYVVAPNTQSASFSPSGSSSKLLLNGIAPCCGTPHDLTPDAGYVALGAGDNGALAWIQALETKSYRHVVASDAGIAFQAPGFVGLLNAADGTIKLWSPPGLSGGVGTLKGISDIAMSNKGEIFAADGGVITRIDPKTDRSTSWTVAKPPAAIDSLSIDSSAKVWFADPGRGVVGALDPVTSSVAEFSPDSPERGGPTRISVTTLGPAFLENGGQTVAVLPLDHPLSGAAIKLDSTEATVVSSPVSGLTGASSLHLARSAIKGTSLRLHISAGAFMTASADAPGAFRDESGGYVTTSQSLFKLPLVGGLAGDALASDRAVMQAQLDPSGFLAYIHNDHDALAKRVTAAVDANDASIRDSWQMFKQGTAFGVRSSPAQGSTFPLASSDEAAALRAMEVAELAKRQAGMSDPGEFQAVFDRLSPEGSLLMGRLAIKQPGLVLLTAAMLPDAIPGIDSLAADPGYGAFTDQFVAAYNAVQGDTARFTGTDRIWVKEDAAFQFLLNLRRLGVWTPDVSEASKALDEATSLTQDYLARLKSSQPPAIKVMAFLTTDVTDPAGPSQLDAACVAMVSGFRQVIVSDLRTVKSASDELAAARPFFLAAAPAQDRSTLSAAIDDALASDSEYESAAKSAIQTLQTRQLAMDQAANSTEPSFADRMLGVATARADLKKTPLFHTGNACKAGFDFYNKVYPGLSRALLGEVAHHGKLFAKAAKLAPTPENVIAYEAAKKALAKALAAASSESALLSRAKGVGGIWTTLGAKTATGAAAVGLQAGLGAYALTYWLTKDEATANFAGVLFAFFCFWAALSSPLMLGAIVLLPVVGEAFLFLRLFCLIFYIVSWVASVVALIQSLT